MKIEMSLFNPTNDPNNYAVDVYVNGERKYCGKGGKTVGQCLKEVNEFVERTALEVYVGKFARSVESNWLGKVVEVDKHSPLLKMKGVNEINCSIIGGPMEDHLDDDDVRWFVAEDLRFMGHIFNGLEK